MHAWKTAITPLWLVCSLLWSVSALAVIDTSKLETLGL